MSETLGETVSNAINNFVNETFQKSNSSAKIPATPEGKLVAYTALISMAVVPIIIGAYRSVAYLEKQKLTGEKPDTITKDDAMKFPLVASCMLFGIYVFFKLFSQDHINILVSFYFFILGIFAMAHIIGPYVEKLIPASFPNLPYHLHLTEGSEENKSVLLDLDFDRKYVVSIALFGLVSGWYAVKKHWLANNLIGLCFAMNGVELLQLSSIGTGCILLIGLFFYDVFWVFGTNVMVQVAKKFDAPIKLVFPQDFLVEGVFGKNMAMLGLGDIVIPGIFIALLLRFDKSLKRDKNLYFNSGMIAYFTGLLTTIIVMTVFNHAQPALLYLVPACISVPLGVAFYKGDLEAMFSYSDEKSEKTEPEKQEDTKKSD
uniref:Presenilin-like protein 3 n=1 Tax=Ciona intestinalis TaxID=7719 RepID=Q68A31_CIOIN|nr:presenilin-like protein 3 [Ciona intestinalis]BAD38618.1 presenilin-like protein 3 [Ciona intestinalis]|eukprot:NP_001027969.1 presenilin-like protein 3 [Ciona intestinalis]